MKKMFLLLVLCYPFLLSAQHDDIYFVPTKDKQVIINIENSSVTIDNDGVYANGNLEDAYDDGYYEYDNEEYRYSTRILRFRSPRLYWGLMYDCGMNDWMVYDDGYYLDLYPAYSNPLYYWPTASYNWCVWDSWYYQRHHWGYHPAYHWNGHHHGGFRPPYIAHNSWRPVHKVHKGIPLNKGDRQQNVSVNNNSKRGDWSASTERGGRRVLGQQGVPVSNRVVSANTSDRVNSTARNNDGRSTAVRRPQSQRSVNNSAVNQRNNSVRSQQVRSTSDGTAVRKENAGNRSDAKVRTNGERRTKSSSSSNSSRSSYRSGSSSSGEYNRPSSTSVSRQRSSSSGVRSSSYGGGSHQRGNSTSRGGTRR